MPAPTRRERMDALQLTVHRTARGETQDFELAQKRLVQQSAGDCHDRPCQKMKAQR